jgi:hypothetical protein
MPRELKANRFLLVADIQLAIGLRWMRPRLAIHLRAGQIAIILGIGVEQEQVAAVFAHGQPTVRRGTTGQSALTAAANAVPIQRRPQWTLSMLTRAVQQSSQITGTWGEAHKAAERILQEFADW